MVPYENAILTKAEVGLTHQCHDITPETDKGTTRHNQQRANANSRAMKSSYNKEAPRLHTRWAKRLTWIIAIAWVLSISVSLVWNWQQLDRTAVALAANEARASFQKDLVYRRWAAMQGGVYVPPSENTPPNPFLAHLPNRDLTTTDGKKLTLVNPAYMTRQVHELGMEQYGVQGHITSLKPIRPKNAADPWETHALKAFESGANEISSIEQMKDGTFLRLMRPLVTEQSCLKCHASQGYKAGEIRGGISVSVPMGPYVNATRGTQKALASAHGTAGLLGLVFLFVAGSRLRRSERALWESEERFRQLVESAPTPIMAHQDGRFVLVNAATVTLFGARASDELIGTPIIDRVHPDCRTLVRERIGQMISTGGSVPLIEERLLRMDGSIIDAEVVATSFVHQGKPTVQIVIRDITERKRVEADLLHHKAQLEAIYNSAPIMMCLVNEQGQIERMNRAMAELAGPLASERKQLKPGEVLGCINALTTSEGCGSSPNCIDCPLKIAIQKTLQTGVVQNQVEASIQVTREGGKHTMVVSASTTTLRLGKELKLLLCFQDITQQRQLEQQLQQVQKMEAIGQLAGGVAHDFNNMLAAIMMNLSLLQGNSSLDMESNQLLLELMDSAKRAARLTRQLLMFSRRASMEIRSLDLNELVTNLLKMLHRLIGENIELRFDRCSGLPTVQADPGMIEQVLMNLCLNSRDAMPRGGTLTIVLESIEIDEARAKKHAEGRVGTYVCLSVADTGIGMDNSTLERIFQPFFTTKEVGKGTGLGLATVHGIIGQHRGWIEVESQLGHGTRFYVFIPAVKTKTESPELADKSTLFRGHETILLVEDDVNLLQVTKRSLQLLGYQVLEASNATEALSVWNQHSLRIDLLITDMIMPGEMTGGELANKLRELKPSLKVIVVSGYTFGLEVTENSAIQGQQIHHLQKPYQIEDLSRFIRTCLGVLIFPE